MQKRSNRFGSLELLINLGKRNVNFMSKTAFIKKLIQDQKGEIAVVSTLFFLATAVFWILKPIKKGVEIPLTIDFSGNEKAIHYLAGCETSTDGGVVAKAFKWNGSTFAEFEYEESPE